MLTTYKFKLKPTLQQIQTLEQDRKNCLYVKNRMIGDREFTYHAQHILGDYCSLHNKKTYTVTALRSNLETNCLESGLQCSINRNASLGEPYKAKTLAKRSAYEMQSSFLPTLKELKPELKLTSAGALQNAVKQVDLAFSRFFKKQAKHPTYKKIHQIGINYSDTECKVAPENYAVYLSSSIGWVKFYNSRQFGQGMKFSRFVVTQEADGWYVSILVKDESLPTVKQKTEFKSVTIEKLGIVSLSLVKRKVTPKPEITGSQQKRESLGLPDEPRNPQSKVEYVQLNLFDLKSEWETG